MLWGLIIFRIGACFFFLFWTCFLQGDLFSGREIISKVTSQYEADVYGPFLRGIDEQYKRAGACGLLYHICVDWKEGGVSFQEDLASLKAEKRLLAPLRKSLRLALLEAISKNPQLEIVKRIDSYVFGSFEAQYDPHLLDVRSLKGVFPKSDALDVEEKMKALATQYHLKELLLNLALISEKGSETVEEKKIALELEMFDQMEIVAQRANAPIWVEKIEKAKKAFLMSKAAQIDFRTLKELALGNIEAKNPVEKKVRSIIMGYLQEKLLLVEN